MNNAMAKPSADPAPTPSGKKSYRPPQLQAFGKLHLRTQGSNGTKGDGSAGMTRAA
jgi:hypothetical protein